MEQSIQVTAACVIAAILALVLRKESPELALLVILAAVVVAFLGLSGLLMDLMAFLQELSDKTGVSQELFVPLYKTIGIALIVRIGGSLCRDAGGTALAAVIEMAGSICALLVALPLLRAVLSMLLELMKA